MGLCLLFTACGSFSDNRRSGVLPSLEDRAQQDPSLSGNGRYLASVFERGGRQTVLLQEQPSGRPVPLPQLRRHQPHHSPSLSWNGRYLGLIMHKATRRQVVVLDRLTGIVHHLPLPGQLQVQRLSLSPDGQRVALQVLRQGKTQVQVYDLARLLEPDRPAGVKLPGSSR